MTTELPTTELGRGLVLAAVGLVAGFVLIGVAASGTRLFSLSAPDAPPSETVPMPLAALPAEPGAPKPEAAPAEPPSRAAADAPAFDVVRVEPDGASVVAGRSRPGAEVELLRDGQPFARTTADAAGNFALVPPALPPGSHEITLRSTAPDGQVASGQASAVVVVAQDRRARPLVAVTAPGRPTAVLSLPETAKPSDAAKPAEAGRTAPASPAPPVKVVGVDAEPGGRLYVTAQGAPKADLRLYLNDTLVAPGRAAPDGRIAFTIGSGVKPGDYRVRIDQVDPASGAVKARAETAFAVPPALERPTPAETAVRLARPSPSMPAGAPSPAVPSTGATAAAPDAARALLAPTHQPSADHASADPGAVFVPGISTAKVIRGDNLWSISRRAYGKGLRYTVIFDANQGQIRDPDRIYPGQVFVLPGEASQGQRQTPDSPG